MLAFICMFGIGFFGMGIVIELLRGRPDKAIRDAVFAMLCLALRLYLA